MDSIHRTEVPPPAPGEKPASGVAATPEWVACMRELCGLLWPPPAVITLESGKSGWLSDGRSPWHWLRGPAERADGEFALVRGVHQPPLLVPAARREAAAAVRHYAKPRAPTARLGVNALTFLLAGGMGGAFVHGRVHISTQPESETIETYLKNVMSRDIRVSMYVGPPRANRKPVLHLGTEAGEPAGFAKIGINPLTQRLVRAERDALARLGAAGLTRIVVPRVLHYGTWHGFDVLVLSTLPVWERPRVLSGARLAAAMEELASVDGLWREPLGDSGYLPNLRSRLAAVDAGADRSALLQAIDALSSRKGNTVLTFGAWHGDWAPWNMANTDRGLMVWDWERFSPSSPLGFDALHNWLQTGVRAGHHAPRVLAAICPERAPDLLAPFGIAAREARITATLYLSDLAARYLFDRQAQAGAPLGAPGTWLIPAIVGEVARR